MRHYHRCDCGQRFACESRAGACTPDNIYRCESCHLRRTSVSCEICHGYGWWPCATHDPIGFERIMRGVHPAIITDITEMVCEGNCYAARQDGATVHEFRCVPCGGTGEL